LTHVPRTEITSLRGPFGRLGGVGRHRDRKAAAIRSLRDGISETVRRLAAHRFLRFPALHLVLSADDGWLASVCCGTQSAVMFYIVAPYLMIEGPLVFGGPREMQLATGGAGG